MKSIPIIVLASIIFIGCSSSTKLNTIDETLELFDKKFNDTLFSHAHWGVLIESLTTGEVWYERNSDRMFMPASNEKIPTAAAALITLGPEFKYRTHYYYSGGIIDSVLHGDIVVVGNGDPTFYNRFYKDPRDPFLIFADTLIEMGIKTVTGNIIGDDNVFDNEGYGYGWPLDGLDSWYSAESGALQFNENYIDLKIIPPTTVGDTVIIVPNVNSDYFTINKIITVVDSGRTHISVNRPFGENEITVSGTIVAGSKEFERSPSIFNPTLYYTTVLKETLITKGINVSGNAIDCDDLTNWDSETNKLNLIKTHQSPPLDEMLKMLMKRSQNMYAETMVKTMGWKNSGTGSFAEGKKVVESVLSSFGVLPDTYAYMDGSGLSRYDFISPHQIVKILKGMYKSEYWDIWRDMLPIAGIDGTLRNRMKGTKAEGNVRAKTGTISNVRGLSGYVTTANGEEIVFSFLINGHLKSSRDTELITDSVLEMLAEYPDIILEPEKVE